jgi:hypothetical protein
VSVSTDGGNTWSGAAADHPTTLPFRGLLYPALTVDANGYLHVVWKGSQNTASPYHYEIYTTRSTDSGATWSGLTQEQMVSYYPAGDPSSNIPCVGADYHGNVIVVWDEEYDFGRNEIMVSTSTNGGLTWSGSTQDEIISFPDAYPGYRPFVAVGLDDTLHVFWNEGTTSTGYYQIHYSRGDALTTVPSVDITLTPVYPPIQIPASGGSFSFNAMVANTTTTPQTFVSWIKVVLPNGAYYGPVLGPLTLTLPASLSVTRLRTQSVPAIAPAGLYSYRGYVGTSLATPYDSSSFPVTKLATGNGPLIADWSISGGWPQAAFIPSGVTMTVSPNPFNATTTISCELRAASYVSLKIYDAAGRLVETLVEGWREAGEYQVTFDGSKLATGVYVYRLEAGENVSRGKMVLLK